MKSKYYISIMRKVHPKYVVLDDEHEHIFSTDSKYELKIWLDLKGLKYDKYIWAHNEMLLYLTY